VVQAEIAMTLGQFARASGDREAALAHLDRAETLATELGHTWAWSSVQWVRAKVFVDRDLDLGAPALGSLSAMVTLTMGEGDATGTLAGLLTAVGAATCAGDPRSGAVLPGSVGALAVPAAAVAEGASLDLAGACALVHDLARRAE
jgi:hypothetical protein